MTNCYLDPPNATYIALQSPKPFTGGLQGCYDLCANSSYAYAGLKTIDTSGSK